MNKITLLKVSNKSSVLLSFDIDVSSEARQDIADRFGRATGLPTMVVDKHVSVTVIEPKEENK